MTATLADFSSTAGAAALVVAGLAIVIAVVVLPRWWARRGVLIGIRKVMEDLTAGRAERRADPTARGEEGRLARAANQLAGVLGEWQTQAAQNRENLAAVLQHSSDIVLATDEDDRIQLINPSGAAMLERPAASIMGQALATVFPQRDLLDLYRAAYSSEVPVMGQIRLLTPRRTIQCQITATTMYVGSRYRGTLILLRDLTEITNAFQMKTDFVANASHELRTPLASIRAAVETIQESWDEMTPRPRGPETDTVRRCIDIIGGHVLRLQMMVQDLLDLSRTEDPRALVRLERVDLVHVCELITGMFVGLAAEKKVTLHTELAPDARLLRGDERLLILTLKNLVDNAIKFTPPGGHVVIRSYKEAPAARRHSTAETPGAEINGTENAAEHNNVEHNGSALTGYAPLASSFVLEVADDGCGIPEEDQQRVFERFYTVNRSRGGADRGTGLGLAIVKHAVAAMNGVVTLESHLNRGTNVRCTFPVRQMEAAGLQVVGA